MSRRQPSSNKAIWHESRLKHDFYLHGYKHPLIVRERELRQTIVAPEQEIGVGIDVFTRGA